MRLWLFRHGIAIDRDDPACPAEAARYLTEEGVKRTREAARGLRRLIDGPQAILASPYIRARQTAEIVAETLGFPLDRLETTKGLLPEAAGGPLLRGLGRRGEREIVAVGHAPNLDEVIAAAVGARSAITALKKAGVAVLEFEEVGPGRGTLAGLYSPKALRAMR